MEQASAYVAPVWAIAVYFLFVLVIVGIMVVLPRFLGERHREQSTNLPYESGIVSTGTARIRIDIQFYLVAVVFLIFDLETAFILAWGIAFKHLGWPGVVEIALFVGLLALMLVYLVRVGALDWRKKAHGRRRER